MIERHKNYDPRILEKLNTQTEAELKSLSTSAARKYYNMKRQVHGCLCRAKMFTRLETSKNGILYAHIEPEHHIEDLLIRWFKFRFPLYTIVIETQRGCFVCEDDGVYKVKKPMAEVVSMLEKNSKEDNILKDLELEENAWEIYLESQFIKPRRNKRQFLKMVPKKFHNWNGMENERDYEMCRTLAEFY
ncbi:DUF4130 domain-containing protein [Candidatus Woesearchaeota archaeon]|nr:DUF4130 domain-containing protein [Candidatus Woesearchaeota archaeon]